MDDYCDDFNMGITDFKTDVRIHDLKILNNDVTYNGDVDIHYYEVYFYENFHFYCIVARVMMDVTLLIHHAKQVIDALYRVADSFVNLDIIYSSDLYYYVND